MTWNISKEKTDNIPIQIEITRCLKDYGLQYKMKRNGEIPNFITDAIVLIQWYLST